MSLAEGIRKLGPMAGTFTRFFASFLFAIGLPVATTAQQVTGQLGAPSATTTVNGKQLPAPPPPFGGVIKQGAKDSTPWWPPRVVPPTRTPVDFSYDLPFRFNGTIDKLTYNLGPSQLSAEDQKKVQDAVAKVND